MTLHMPNSNHINHTQSTRGTGIKLFNNLPTKIKKKIK